MSRDALTCPWVRRQLRVAAVGVTFTRAGDVGDMPRRSAVLSLLALVASTALADPAGAAPPWSAPRPVADFDVRDPTLAFNTAGAGVGVVRFGAGASRLLALGAGPAASVVATRDVGSVVDGPVPYGHHSDAGPPGPGPGRIRPPRLLLRPLER